MPPSLDALRELALLTAHGEALRLAKTLKNGHGQLAELILGVKLYVVTCNYTL